MIEKIAIGIDIGGTNTVFGIVSEIGKIIMEDSMSTSSYPKPDEFVGVLSGKIKSLLKSFGTNHHLIGIGVGAPNGNYYSGTVEYPANLAWKGITPLAELLNAHFDLPVIITNDANAGALGEMLYGGAKGMKDFIFITLGTGVGSGIVSNGKIVYGHDGFAGEIGHTNAIPDGRQCGCGRKGCLETYASATGIVRTANEFLKTSDKNSLLCSVEKAKLNSKVIYEMAIKGDELALEVFDYTTDILGRALADSVAYTSPEAIFLFGGIANAEDLILKPLKQKMEGNLLTIYKDKVKILPSKLKNGQAAILGAAALIWTIEN